MQNGASFIYREDNSRYIGVQFSVEGRDLAGAVNDARRQVQAQVPLPEGYRLDWGGEYKNYTASRRQLNVVLPLTVFVIFLLLFALYRNFKFPLITVLGVVLSAPVGGIVALWLTHTPFSVSSAHRVPGLVRRLGPDGGSLYLLRERTARRGHGIPSGHSRRRDPAAAPDHDDGAGGRPGAVAGGDRHRRPAGAANASGNRRRQRPRAATSAVIMIGRGPAVITPRG